MSTRYCTECGALAVGGTGPEDAAYCPEHPTAVIATPARTRWREPHDLHGTGAVACEVYARPPHVDYWPAVTDVPCPVRGCGGAVRWAEAGFVPGYRMCDRPRGRRHRFLARGTAEAPVLVRDACCER